MNGHFGILDSSDQGRRWHLIARLVPCVGSTRSNLQHLAWASCVLAIGLMLFDPLEVKAQDLSPVAEWTEDSNLNDIFFLDPDIGWAVGDRGTILRTVDGGRRWEATVSPINCTLESVFFIDPRNGWAVGGNAKPLTHLSSGVVLRTEDGGKTWRRVSSDRIPWVKRIGMDTDRTGWALAHRSPVYGSGLMLTQDGGMTWRPYPGEVPGQWTAGARLGANQFALVGKERSATIAKQGELETAVVWPTGEFSLNDMAMVDGQHGWAVGNAGAVLLTKDAGTSWDDPPAPLLESISSQYDFHAVAARGDRVWIAGSPGTKIGRSFDQGRTWQWTSTGSNFPIQRLFFWDENRGWAVGAMGTILATLDGGETWRKLRGGASGVAIYGCYESEERLPLEFFARYSGNDGHLSAVGILRPTHTNELTVSPAADRARFALSNMGVSGFSFDWSGFRGKRSEFDNTWIVERLVREFRTWRPVVIVCDAPDDDNAARLYLETIQTAFRMAADEQQFSDQITTAGLQPFQPSKLYVRVANDERADEVLALHQFAPRLGTSLEDYCLTSNGLIREYDFGWSLRHSWRLVETENGANFTSDSLVTKSVFSGVQPDRLRELQRAELPPGPGNLEVMRRQAKKWEWIDRIVVTSQTTTGDPEIWMREVEGLLIGLSKTAAGNVLFQLGIEHESNGQHESAARAMHMLATDYSDHPLWDGAMMWLIKYYSSAEARWILDPNSRKSHIEIAGDDSEGNSTSDETRFDGMIRRTGFEDPVEVPFSAQQKMRERWIVDVEVANRNGHARQLGDALSQRRPVVASLAKVQMSQAALERTYTGMQDTPLQTITAARHASGDWPLIAEIEDWLRDPVDAPPVPVLLCRQQRIPPKLDGLLDDPIWQSTPSIDLELLQSESSQGGTKTSLQIVFDEEFMFLAIRGNRVTDNDQPNDAQANSSSTLADSREAQNEDVPPRQRDAILSDADRVCIAFDVDRDYASSFMLEVSEDGACNESALGLRSWNPQWFIASDRSEEEWTLEIAIPFSQLGRATPMNREAWAVAIQRCLPGEKSPFKASSFLDEPTTDSVLMFVE